MGNDCCKSTPANQENERTMLTKDPSGTADQKEVDKSGEGSEAFQIRINNNEFFSLSGVSKTKPVKQFYASEREALSVLNDIKPLKNITIKTLINNKNETKPDPTAFVQKEHFSGNVQRISLQNSGFFNEGSNGETAYLFLYHAVLKKAKKFNEMMKNESFVNFISENDYDGKNTVCYDSFVDFINLPWINTNALQHFRLFLFNDFAAQSKSIDALIQTISKLKSKSFKSFELGLKTYNDYDATLKENALLKSITSVLSGKEKDLETFSLLLHTGDKQDKILLEVGDLVKKTQKLSEFNLFLRTITSSANIAQFAESLFPKMSQMTSFSLGLSSLDDKPDLNVSDSNLQALLGACKKQLPQTMNSFSFFISTYKCKLDATLANMLEIAVMKTFNAYNLALEGNYENENIDEQIKAKIKKKNPSADIGMVSLDT